MGVGRETERERVVYYVLCVFMHAVCRGNRSCDLRATLVTGSLKRECQTARIKSPNSSSYLSKSEAREPEMALWRGSWPFFGCQKWKISLARNMCLGRVKTDLHSLHTTLGKALPVG